MNTKYNHNFRLCRVWTWPGLEPYCQG